ncbi:MAG: SDR family NAD(P)-dependent oxidoreductase [Sphingomonadaceae bacterium]|nr:SDR family NAD(P)-dependent oxidoreductase [Sphingomonadaceae bacterium]
MSGASGLVIGVGASTGLGAAVARRMALAGLHVVVAGRTRDRLDQVVGEIGDAGGKSSAVVCDATSAEDVASAVAAAESIAPMSLAVFNAGGNRPRALLESDPAFFEEMWRVGCFAGHLFTLHAAPPMLARGSGTLIFTGASASLRGRAGFEAFASAKAGLRAIAQAAAREFGPKGVHVAHVVIDGAIDGERVNTRLPHYKDEKGPDGMLSLDAIAEAYWQIHLQHRSAWTHELDLRPWAEPF